MKNTENLLEHLQMEKAMKKIAILLMCGLVTGTVAADENNSSWVKIASTDVDGIHAEVSAKKGSFRHDKKTSSMLVQQIATKKDNGESSVQFYKVAISDDACDNGYGSISYFNLKGQKEFDGDYIHEGQNVASEVGAILCVLKAKPPEQGQG